MPELPEVETIKNELEKAVLGKKITDVIVNNPKVIKEPKLGDFVKGLKNTTIKSILRKGKLLILELSSRSARSSGKSLTIHLKMTGQLIYPSHQKLGGWVNPGKISRVSFKFSDNTLLDFNDSRLFGELRVVNDWRNLKFIQALGPEPFDLTEEKFKQMLANKKTKIKILLMDQKFISGIGNLYANEALFRAKIHPERPALFLSEKEKEKLFKEIKNTLLEAIKYKGSSVGQYLQLSGKAGEYVKYHKVYNREGEPCLQCKGKIKRIVLSGRGTYFCPKCQRI